jgi:hypothetical protein
MPKGFLFAMEAISLGRQKAASSPKQLLPGSNDASCFPCSGKDLSFSVFLFFQFVAWDITKGQSPEESVFCLGVSGLLHDGILSLSWHIQKRRGLRCDHSPKDLFAYGLITSLSNGKFANE